MNIKLSIKNFKLIDDLRLELDSSNLYKLSGRNNVGKTSVLQALTSLLKAKNNVPDPVQYGKDDSTVTGVLEINNNIYSVTMESQKDGKTKFTLVNKDGIKTTSINNIRDIFNFQDFTAEEFVSWGKTAEGRRKQTEVFLNCLEKERKIEYDKLSEEEEKYYQERTPFISDITHYTKSIKDVDLSEREILMMTVDSENILKAMSDSKIRYDNFISSSQKMDYLENELKHVDDTYTTVIENINSNKLKIEKQIKELTDSLSDISLQKDNIDSRYNTKRNSLLEEIKDLSLTFNKDDKSEIETEYEKSLSMKNIFDNVKNKYINFKNIESKLKTAKDKNDEISAKIDEIRESKKKIISDNPILSDIVIIDNNIYILDNNNILPLNGEQISQSKQMMLACKILLKLNKDVPLLLVGRGESLDNDNLEKLADMAKDTDSIIILEKVIERGDLQIELLCEE